MVKKKISELRKQALEDFKYISKKYGAGNSNDYDDMRLMKLLETPCEEEAFKILMDYLIEYFDLGYVSNSGMSETFPKDDNVLNEIKERWNL